MIAIVNLGHRRVTVRLRAVRARAAARSGRSLQGIPRAAHLGQEAADTRERQALVQVEVQIPLAEHRQRAPRIGRRRGRRVRLVIATAARLVTNLDPRGIVVPVRGDPGPLEVATRGVAIRVAAVARGRRT
jgi:hypothetical protein